MQPRTYHALPSWLPDWGPSKPSYPLCSFASSDKPEWPFFDAENGTEATVEISSSRVEGDNPLRCQGLQVDTVDGVAGDRYVAEPRFVRQSQFSENAYSSRSGAFEALCRTVTAHTNRMDAWGPPPPEFRYLPAKRWQELNNAAAGYEQGSTQTLPNSLYPQASGFERAWRSMRGLNFGGEPVRTLMDSGPGTDQVTSTTLKSLSESGGEPAPASSHPLWTALEHSAGQACFERLLFTTIKGHFGIGPATTEPGDKVAILLGCKVPVLLRPEKEHHLLIGESYVDGIMYGEATSGLRGSAGSTPSLEEIVIY